jgi:hypothetical protein
MMRSGALNAALVSAISLPSVTAILVPNTGQSALFALFPHAGWPRTHRQ